MGRGVRPDLDPRRVQPPHAVGGEQASRRRVRMPPPIQPVETNTRGREAEVEQRRVVREPVVERQRAQPVLAARDQRGERDQRVAAPAAARWRAAAAAPGTRTARAGPRAPTACRCRGRRVPTASPGIPCPAVPVSAVLLTFNRREMAARVLDELDAQGCADEVIIVDASTDGTAEMARARGARVLEPGDLGAAGRNVGAAAATHDLVLFIDDDSHPEPGAVTELDGRSRPTRGSAIAGRLHPQRRRRRQRADRRRARLVRLVPALGLAGRPPRACPSSSSPRARAWCAATPSSPPAASTGRSSSRCRRSTPRCASPPPAGRSATSRARAFAHLKQPGSDGGGYGRMLHLRVRNELWHFWLRYPPAMAIPRMVGYLAFDLVECAYRRGPRRWIEGVRDAWRLRATVAADRNPLPRAVLRDVERNRAQHARRAAVGAAAPPPHRDSTPRSRRRPAGAGRRGEEAVLDREQAR